MVTVVLFWSTRYAGFVTDFTGFQQRILENDSLWGAFNSYGFPAFQPILNIVLYTLYKVFGVGSIGYFFVYCLVHAFNGFIAYLLFTELTKKNLNPPELTISSNWLAIIASLIFLLHPYNVEPLVWKVCINAILSTSFILSALYFFVKNVKDDRFTIVPILLAACAMMTFEFGIITFLLFLILLFL